MLKAILEKLEIKPEDNFKTALYKGVAEGFLEGATILGSMVVVSGIIATLKK